MSAAVPLPPVQHNSTATQNASPASSLTRMYRPAANGGPVISGTKISLTVHYGKADTSKTGSVGNGNTGYVRRMNNDTVMDGYSSSEDTVTKVEKSVQNHTVVTEKRESSSHTVTQQMLKMTSQVTDNSANSIVTGETKETGTVIMDLLVDGEQEAVGRLDQVLLEQEPVNSNKEKEYWNGPDQVIPTEDFCAWQPDGAVKLKIGEKGPSSIAPISIPSVFQRTVSRYPDHLALAVKRNGNWVRWTFQEYLRDVRTCAKAFIHLGLDRFHTVSVLGFNAPEWLISDLAAIFAGGFSCGIYTTNSPEACQYVIEKSRSQIVVVENRKLLEKILLVRSQLPMLKTIVLYDEAPPDIEGVISWSRLMQIGAKVPDSVLEDRLKRIAINQCCILVFTSGTTGSPKGVMLNHDSATWLTAVVCDFMGMKEKEETVVSYLPLSHIAAQACDIYAAITVGISVYFAKPDALKGSLVTTLKEVQPTVFFGVPRVWEKIFEKMQDVARQTRGLKKIIAQWAKGRGLEYNMKRMEGSNTIPFGFGLANAIVLQKVHQALGLDKAHVLVTGAAPISVEIMKYFMSLNLLIFELYGMSECTGPQTVNNIDAFKIGSVGKTLPGTYTKLHDPDPDGHGEICIGGRNVFMGYLNMPDKTKETVDDEGWLHTGDIGQFDKDNFLHITGRLKELIITAGGENIPPIVIEDKVKEELPCISEAMLIGDKRKFLSILLTICTEVDIETGEPTEELTAGARQWCHSVGSSASTIADILIGPDVKVMRAIQSGIDRANARATSNAQKIGKWSIVPIDFSVPGGELGPTMKMRRPYILKKYNSLIERFYENT